MPVYHVEHAIPLTISQQDELAEAITKLHSERFSTPRLFVNVHFVDVADAVTYIGGKRRTGSHIKANVRSGPSRSQEDWDELNELAKRFADAIPEDELSVRGICGA